MSKKRIMLGAIAVVVCAGAGICFGDLITVNGDGTGDYETIQAGIDASSNGDEIEVAPGTYNEAINFNGKAVRLYSSGGPEITTIDGSGSGTSVVVCINSEDANTVLEGFTITGGYSINGGGMYNGNSSPTVIDCTFSGNSSISYGGGMYNNYNSSPAITNCTFSGNSTTNDGGGMYNLQSSPTLTNCTFRGNSSGWNGGGMCNQSSSNPTVTDCTFSGNTASNRGGGMYNSVSSATLTNCTFRGNTASSSGGGMYNFGCNPTLTNCTFSGNSATTYGGGMYNEISSSTVTNCILWGNSPDEIYNNSSSPTVSYCDVQGGYGEGEGNNIDADPCFLDAASGDFHLLFGSPCIDAGTNSAASLPSTDFEGDNRIINGIVDMGADEYICDPAILPSPADGASMVSVDVQLSWTAGVGSVSHDVWFGTENPPTTLIADDITETNTDPGVLEYGVTYYWQVDENTSEGTVTGDVWSFRTEIPDIWVDDDYTYDGLNDGHTWGIDAFANIGAGIDMAEYGTTVHVAAGVYMENITLKNGVALIGAGTGSALIYAGGSGRVVYSSGCDANTILEGFIITGGYSSYGGGMYNKGSSPTVASCTFTSNTAFLDDYGGGGMFNNASSNPIVTNCTFIDNLAGCQGGGMYNYNSSSPTVTNCTFSGNSANFCGGGMCNYSDSNPTLTNCAFSRNSATYYGGGMFNNASSSPRVTNCTFSGNTATNDGGGMYNYRNSNPTLTNCAFSGNSSDFGGGMYNFNSSSPTITNCTFSDNSAGQYGGGMYNSDNSTPTLTNCIMWGNSAVNSPIEIYNINSTPVISFSDIAFCGGSGAGWMGFMGVDGGGNIDKDPLFGGDLHLKSEFGRATTDPSLPFGTWVVDTVTSPCIDAGDPNMAVGNEPEGNGGRINMGYYGGTYHASKSSYVGTIEGDVNGDGKVDFLDFAIMAENWLIDCDVEPSNPECIPK